MAPRATTYARRRANPTDLEPRNWRMPLWNLAGLAYLTAVLRLCSVSGMLAFALAAMGGFVVGTAVALVIIANRVERASARRRPPVETDRTPTPAAVPA